PRGIRHLNVYGPLARSVEDLKLCLSIIAGPDQRDWEVPPVPLFDSPALPITELRLAWIDDFGGVPVTAETRSALETLAVRLAALGCRVERAEPPRFDYRGAWDTYGETLGAETGVALSRAKRWLAHLRGPIVYRKEPLFRAISRAYTLDMRRYAAALT